MAEVFAKFKRFEYRENSNLVLQREGPGLQQNEPTGEPESLAGRITGPMGDRAQHSRPDQETLEAEAEASARAGRKRVADEEGEDILRDMDKRTAKRARKLQRLQRIMEKTGVGGGAVDMKALLRGDLSTGGSEGAYVPSNEANRVIWEQLLGIVQRSLGDQPRDVLAEAGEEVLRICKTEGVAAGDRLRACRESVPDLDETNFSRCLLLSKQVTDFNSNDEAGGTTKPDVGDELEGTHGVAVIWDDEEEAEMDYERLLAEDEENSDSEDENDSDNEDIGVAQEDSSKQVENLTVNDIGPHWLQRKLQDVLKSDPDKLIAVEKEILSELANPDVNSVENRLVRILEFENFKFVQTLTQNHHRILYMTLLGQAQTEEEKEELKRKMAETVGGRSVLEELDAQNARRNREQDFARSVQREAEALAAAGGHSNARLVSQTADGDEVEENAAGGIGMAESEDSEDNEEMLRQPSKLINLQDFAFPPDQKFIGVEDVKLPEGTERHGDANHDEIDIPPPNANIVQGEVLKVSECLPAWAQPCFESVGVKTLNLVQSKVFPCAFENVETNMLICAPTGAGKTNVAMLAILGLIGQYLKSAEKANTVVDLSAFKIVYVSPMKALVAEQVAAFQKRLDTLNAGLKVAELTGDIGLSQKQISETQIIVTTPEKWDVITRKAGERTYTQLVQLMIFDEIHLLHDNRGPVLEALIARATRHSIMTQRHIRLVGLSATLPNYKDVAIFMRVPIETGLFVFGNQYRPVPLRQTFIGIRTKKALKRYTILNELCYKKVLEYAGKKQILIFVHSRKETVRTAKFLRDKALEDGNLINFFEEGSASKEILNEEKKKVKNRDLEDVLPFGFGCHHAGMERKDRKLIEDLFADRHLQVLVSTATLAWGVNLPAHTVIIKGTQVYSPDLGKWTELPPLDVVQMMGRGGRPQYDSQGHGIILTEHNQLQYYISLTNQQLPIESQMISHLVDILNAEIVLGTIRHRRDAVKWLTYTYLYVRMLRNPQLYGLSVDDIERDGTLLQRRIDLCHAALLTLDTHRLIHYDKRTGSIHTTALGRAASHYYLKYQTVAVLNKLLTPTLTDIELFRLFSMVSEFALVPVRPEEKSELIRVVERVPIPIKGQLSEPSTKINVLLQSYVSRLKLEGFALQADMGLVEQNAGRIMRAIFEISLRRGWAVPARLALLYSKVIDRRMWSTMTPLRQFKGLGMEDIKRIERRDFGFDRYADLTPAELGELVKNPQLGKKLYKLVHQFPKVEVTAFVQPITPEILQFELTVAGDFEWSSKAHFLNEVWWVFVENVDSDKLLHYDQFTLKKDKMDTTMTFTVQADSPPSPHYFIRVMNDRWVGAETTVTVSFKDLVLPAKNPPATELLGLKPLPISSLNFPQAEEKLYATLPEFKESKTFNPIQTQVFGALYFSNENVLLCAPPSSGRTVCAEFAILQMIRNEEVPLCVYIAPYHDIVQSKYLFWKSRFEDSLNLKVSILGGDLNADLKVLARSHIVLSTPENWDSVSRRWKTRSIIRKVKLIIVDYLQLLNDPIVGSTIEVCISRARYVSSSQNIPCRLVGIGTSIADAKDVADWMGVTIKGFFNFHPSVRTIPLELSINRVDLPDREARLLAIYQPMCQSIRRLRGKSVIVISPERREARRSVLEILLFLSAENKPTRCLLVPRAEIEAIITEFEQKLQKPFRERILREALLHGVGLMHEGMRVEERNLVEKLFVENKIQVCIITCGISWSFHRSAHLVFIQDTELWDLKKRRWTHYSINSVVQFLGHAGRPNMDSCQVTLFCRSSKREEFKRFIRDAVPLESNLDLSLADHILPEVVTGTVKTKQDALDWITWTFAYRRLTKNPNFYGLKRATPELISDYLSELVETTTDSLAQANCIAIKDELELVPLNLGLIAAFYYLQYATVEIYNKLVTPTSRHLSLLTTLVAAREIGDRLQIRSGEDSLLRKLFTALELAAGTTTPDYNDPHLKGLILLSSHFKRETLTPDLQQDLSELIVISHRLCQGLVDVTASNGWLTPSLAAMELSQMIVQATMPNRSSLWQLPQVDGTFVDTAASMGIKEVFDISSVEDSVREALFTKLNWSQQKIEALAEAVNNFPAIDISFKITKNGAEMKECPRTAEWVPPKLTNPVDLSKAQFFEGSMGDGTDIVIEVIINREMEDSTLPSVICPHFPAEKAEQWWLVIGDVENGRVAGIKRVTLNKTTMNTTLDLDPTVVGGGKAEVKSEESMAERRNDLTMSLFLMSDSYVGCDQEYPFVVKY